jgi:hypothetical protein
MALSLTLFSLLKNISLRQTARLRHVDRTAYQQQRQHLHRLLAERRDYHRFCHNLDTVVQELEAEWQAAVEAAARSTQLGNLT